MPSALPRTVSRRRPWPPKFDYDLVILDLILPRADGVVILRHLRTRKPSLPIVVLTGRSRVEDRVQCLDLGATTFSPSRFPFPNSLQESALCCGEAIFRRHLAQRGGLKD